MLGNAYKEIEDGEEFDTIEEALLTSCYICGTELEWSIKVHWNKDTELPELHGEAFSCGIKFLIMPLGQEQKGYMTRISS